MATARASAQRPRVSARLRRTSSRQGPRAPMHLVERMQVAVIGLVNAYVDRLMREIEPALQRRFDAESFPIGHVGGQVALGHQFLETTFKLVDRQAASDLARVIPVPTDAVLPHAAKLQQQFIHNNTELIKLEERARAEVRGVIEGPLREGVSVEEVRKKIQERLNVVRSRAELIARDQTLKLYGQIQQARQTAAGIEEYVWSTSEDERVRGNPAGLYPKSHGNHWRLEGTTQRWDDPPIVDSEAGRKEHPGGDYQCRCAAIPILPSEGLEEPSAPPEPRELTPPEPELVNEPANEVVPEPAPAAERPPSSGPPASSEPPTPRLPPPTSLEQLAAEQDLTIVRSGPVEPEHEQAIARALERVRLGQGSTEPLPRLEITTRTGKAETAGQNRLPKGTGGVYFDAPWLRAQGRDPTPAVRIGVAPAHVDAFLALGRTGGRDIQVFRPSVPKVLPNGADVGRFDVPTNTQQLARTAAEVIEWTTTHEYAHHLHLAATNPEIDRLIQEAFRDRRSQPVSIYAMQDPREFFAEAFTAYHHYPRAWLERHTPKTLRLVERVLELSGLK